VIERTLHIGNQSRTLRCSSAATILFKKWIPGGIGLREALLLHCEPATIATAIAAFLYRPGDEKRGSAAEKTGPTAVAAWIDAELNRYPEFEATVLALAEDYFRAAGIIEKAPTPGEAPRTVAASPAPSSTSGTPSSASPAGGGSTPEPSLT
jgi:hypothetical protein